MDRLTAYFAFLHSHIFDPSRLPVAVCALLIVSFAGLITGPLFGNAGPLFWRTIDFLFGPLGGKLDNTGRKRNDLVTRGTIITITGLILCFFIGRAFEILSREFPNYLIIDIVALSIVLSAGAVWHALLRLYKAVQSSSSVKGAFYTLATTSRNNLTSVDEFTITRVGIGMGARFFDKAVVAPVIWYLIAGLPVVYLYAGLAALSWRFGKEGFSKGFGATALALEKLMGFVPNVFAAILISLAGLVTPTAGMARSIFGLFHFSSGRAGYYEGGAPVTAMAWALKVSLGGATQDLDGSAVQRGWAGPPGATARLEAKHLHRAIYILVVSHMLFFLSMLVILVFTARLQYT